MTAAVVIGLEIHVQLATRSKLFCKCPTALTTTPNSQLCPICAGHPGTLPRLNTEAIRLGIRAALALEARVAPVSSWDRKHYFYPDLPKGYQITQHHTPLACGGQIPVWSAHGLVHVPLTEMHLEEDAGKSAHGVDPEDRLTGIDLNRCGVPLLEIVTAPTLHSAKDASAAAQNLHTLLCALGITTGHMQAGQMRMDANVSCPTGVTPAAPRVEIKNLNSFRFLEAAIDAECRRQAQVQQAGGAIHAETRGYDPRQNVTFAMRDKESLPDYRYLPEPDLPALVVTPEMLSRARDTLPPLPHQVGQHYQRTWNLPFAQARSISVAPDLEHYLAAALPQTNAPQLLVNLALNEVARLANGRPWNRLPLGPAHLVALVELIHVGRLSHTSAKALLPCLIEGGEEPELLAAERGLLQQLDAQTLDKLVAQVLATEAAAVARYHLGKLEVFGFLVGQVMKLSGGRAEPRTVQAALCQRLTRRT